MAEYDKFEYLTIPMPFPCPQATKQLVKIKELQTNLAREIGVFETLNNSNSKITEQSEQLKVIYNSRRSIKEAMDKFSLLECLPLIEKLKLREQYDAQVGVLRDSGILKILPKSKQEGIIGVSGKGYPIPSYESIVARFKDPEKLKLIEKKFEQGFVKLQITPFATSLNYLIECYRQTLLRVNSESELETTDGSVLHLNANEIIHVSPGLVDCDNPNTPADKQMEYGVTDYDGKTKKERGGKYKGELLEQPDNGWQMSLIEDQPDLGEEFFARRNSFVPTEIGGRREIVGKKDNNEYLKIFSGNSDEANPYQGEGGQTPESAIVTLLTYLLEDKIVSDDYDSNGLANLLVGTRLPAGTPLFYLNQNAKRIVFYVIGPKEKASKGVRSAVAF